ncbi:SMC-Scp complex subunit ScpB [Solimonas sp. SE-A11]|uniref:SMC-Scp complex subunit ScpB n=1 Tax=Solimonas sp. SE-A11 TaxID=3054954 RepID=UPI00259CFDC6|nr:SMC-Scp complex subunit ScpB [Solimonas sp. SE-A11]MDM4771131.1 SMC-Scp complex subunit ScpB [Solimonas sp. SE-A11]
MNNEEKTEDVTEEVTGQAAEPAAQEASQEAAAKTQVAEPEQSALLVNDSALQLVNILEALLLASELPLSLEQLHRLLGPDLGVSKKDVRAGLDALAQSLEGRACELSEVASGFRIQVRKTHAEWVSRLWQEKPPRMSRALLETLAIICYRQPVTRGEVEEIRGVALSPNIIRTLLERGWIREVGVKEVPGRPSLFGTTHQMLDDLNIKSLDDLPSLPEIKDPAQLEAALSRLGEGLPGAAAALPAPEDEEGEAPAEPEAIAADAAPAEASVEEGVVEEAPGEEDTLIEPEPTADAALEADEPDALGDEPPTEASDDEPSRP